MPAKKIDFSKFTISDSELPTDAFHASPEWIAENSPTQIEFTAFFKPDCERRVQVVADDYEGESFPMTFELADGTKKEFRVRYL